MRSSESTADLIDPYFLAAVARSILIFAVNAPKSFLSAENQSNVNYNTSH